MTPSKPGVDGARRSWGAQRQNGTAGYGLGLGVRTMQMLHHGRLSPAVDPGVRTNIFRTAADAAERAGQIAGEPLVLAHSCTTLRVHLGTGGHHEPRERGSESHGNTVGPGLVAGVGRSADPSGAQRRSRKRWPPLLVAGAGEVSDTEEARQPEAESEQYRQEPAMISQVSVPSNAAPVVRAIASRSAPDNPSAPHPARRSAVDLGRGDPLEAPR